DRNYDLTIGSNVERATINRCLRILVFSDDPELVRLLVRIVLRQSGETNITDLLSIAPNDVARRVKVWYLSRSQGPACKVRRRKDQRLAHVGRAQLFLGRGCRRCDICLGDLSVLWCEIVVQGERKTRRRSDSPAEPIEYRSSPRGFRNKRRHHTGVGLLTEILFRIRQDPRSQMSRHLLTCVEISHANRSRRELERFGLTTLTQIGR